MDTDMHLEQTKGHIESRNEILRELQEIFKKNSYAHTIDLDTCSELDAKQESNLSVLEDILIETNGKSLKKLTEEGSTKCYRCKHFQNIPQNILGDCEKTSNLTEQYEADLTFIQAVVWLKSLTRIMKDISHEQFRLVFHKQWNNILHKRNDTEIDNKNICSEDGKSLNKSTNTILSINMTKEHDLTLDSNLDCTYIDLSNNVKCNKKHNATQFGQDTERNNKHFIKTSSNLSNLSFENVGSSIRSITQNKVISNSYVISDSQSEHSSCSDIFKDSLSSQNTRNANQNKMDDKLDNENNLISVRSIELDPFQSQDELSRYSNSSQTIILESKSDLSANSTEANSVDMFNENCSLYEENVNNLQDGEDKCPSKLTTERMTQYSRVSDSNFCMNKLTISVNNINKFNSLVEDESILLNSKIDNITPHKKCSVVDSLNLPAVDVDEKEWIPDKSQESDLSSLELSLHQENNESTDSTKMIQIISQIVPSSQPSRQWSRKNENFMEDKEFIQTRGKKRKLEFEHEMNISFQKDTKNEEKRISSKWLRFTLDTLNTDDIAFQSMKVILSVLQNEKLAIQYMKNRCWKNTLEMQAVNAVLNFCDIFESENKNNVCINEIVQVITHLLDTSIENTELNKITILIHRISIALELCASMEVCIEVINYLTTKLKSYESILISLMNNRKSDVHDILNQLHIIFYSLSICLQKYRLVFFNKSDNHFEEETTLSVIELWKKQLKFEGVVLKESTQVRERRWQVILNDFSTIAIESFVPFAKMSRRLLNILMNK